MTQEVFKRYEKKYLLSTFACHALLKQLEGRICPDSYGSYSLSNIYFDTPDHALIRESLEKPYYKEKLRLRSYGTSPAASPAFLELKKKCGGIVYKRRMSLSLGEAEDYLYHGIHPAKDSQILREIEWVLSRYSLFPAVYLSYDRTAYTGIQDDGLRITFDTNIRGRQDALSLRAGSFGNALLPPDTVLMEVKLPNAMPLWMSRLFAQMQLYPVSFSKYGSYYTQYICSQQKGNQKYA